MREPLWGFKTFLLSALTTGSKTDSESMSLKKEPIGTCEAFATAINELVDGIGCVILDLTQQAAGDVIVRSAISFVEVSV